KRAAPVGLTGDCVPQCGQVTDQRLTKIRVVIDDKHVSHTRAALAGNEQHAAFASRLNAQAASTPSSTREHRLRNSLSTTSEKTNFDPTHEITEKYLAERLIKNRLGQARSDRRHGSRYIRHVSGSQDREGRMMSDGASQVARPKARLHVLVVEDHADTASAMQKLLSLHGFTVRSVGS